MKTFPNGFCVKILMFKKSGTTKPNNKLIL